MIGVTLQPVSALLNVTIDWSVIDTVLFDMDGTLLDLNFDNVFWNDHLTKRYAQHHQIGSAEARERLVQQFEKTHATLEHYCFDHWSEVTGLDIIEEKQSVKDLIAFRPGSEDLLAALATYGKQRWLVTNSHPAGIELKQRLTGILDHFEYVLSAHDVGAPKEQAAFWEQLYAERTFDPDRTVLFEDNVSVLQAAERFGIRHLVCVAQPDSQRPARSGLPFPSIGHFDDVKPT